ncbi:MAG: dimethyl sulfoxide reductase anchor subunit [Alphaproteobacteria bacterium]|nr:dimethyl sulfoxide reductase anchor subunit [Rhodospirillales bacterium]MCW9045810.1 dimethyl sulfoxide reductase anchor subunit [Alphaproteobacteria bacterium]
MTPAYSVIFFTTASGAGYGLLFLLGLFSAIEAVPADPALGWMGFGLSLGLITFGLLSSTFHLGHPERAWRALTQWQSSWLSREGVLAIFTYGPTVLFAYGWLYLGDTSGVWAVMGVLSALGAAATVFCTSMIYGTLRTIPSWANKWTPFNYMVLGLATGAVLLNALQNLLGAHSQNITMLCVGSLVLAWVGKIGFWKVDPMPYKAGSATGLGTIGEVTSLSSPNTNATFVQREMGFQVARKHADKLRRISVITLFVIPIILTVATVFVSSGLAATFAIHALIFTIIGIVTERWLFFAEAQHVVNLYYGDHRS